MKKHIGKILAALIVIYLLVNMAAVITYPNQYKVIKTMGKISRVTTEPGFSLRIPLIQSETTISKARQLYGQFPKQDSSTTSHPPRSILRTRRRWRLTPILSGV